MLEHLTDALGQHGSAALGAAGVATTNAYAAGAGWFAQPVGVPVGVAFALCALLIAAMLISREHDS